ncbi:MAG: hypothetical protein EBR95_08305 [Verrucomicrobia bacterium]|nr:hypothetical protein [Verrucomicrobiota bacterium]
MLLLGALPDHRTRARPPGLPRRPGARGQGGPRRPARPSRGRRRRVRRGTARAALEGRRLGRSAQGLGPP